LGAGASLVEVEEKIAYLAPDKEEMEEAEKEAALGAGARPVEVEEKIAYLAPDKEEMEEED